MTSARILIVEDDPDTADTLAYLLRGAGHDVCVVSDGRQAVEAVRTYVPTLAILDINMPVLDGYEAARLIRAEQPTGRHLVLIAHTARVEASDVEHARSMGFDHHLQKGIGGDVICALVEALLTTGRRREEPGAPGIVP